MRINCLALSLSIACSGFTASTAYGEAPSPPSKETDRYATRHDFGTDQIASAQGGVHLLEHILSRMRNLPQLALSKTKQTIVMQSQAQAFEPNQAQAINSNLLIKPKGLPRTQLAAKPAADAGGLSSAIDGAKISYSAGAPAAAGYSPADLKDSRQSGVWERPQLPKVNFGAFVGSPGDNVREYPSNEQQNKAKEEEEKRVVSNTPLITEFARAPGDNLYGSDDAMPVATKKIASKSSASHGHYRNYRSQARFQFAPNNYPLEAPQVVDQAVPLGAGLTPPPPAQQRAVPAAPTTPTLLGGTPAVVNRKAPDDAFGHLKRSLSKLDSALESNEGVPWQQPGYYGVSSGVRGRLLSSRKPGGQNLDVALTPPTVITGITLVSLGNSEKEAARSVASLGKMQKESIHGWSVWSIRKRNCSDCAIQVFLRHGIVEAIRIFDPSLLRPELGVTLGDCLSTVKEKFGEPAFILSEPAQLTARNYIYPISQIGFQLARNKQDEVPKIVSMIVFNVK